MILLKKDVNELMQETLEAAVAGGLTEKDAGGVTRLLLSLINGRLGTYYETLDMNLAQAFVSNATDFYLDKIGMLVDCKRNAGEELEAYRYRITKQIQIVASSNMTAVRMAILAVPGVQEVKLKRYTHGTGSFSAYVISSDPITPQSVIDAVNLKIQEGVEAYGVRAEAFRPIVIPVEMRIRLIFNNTVTDVDQKMAIAQTQEAVKTYINSRNVEEPIVIDDLYKAIRATNHGIVEIIIYHFRINGRNALVTDQVCAWNERFVESDKVNAIQVS